MWLVAGLGNPGPRYARNRHNVGFRVVDLLASRHGLGELRSGGKLGGDVATGMIVTPRGRQRVALLKPMEFMNLSGFAVQRAMRFHDVEVSELLVVHDEIDLDLGLVRVKSGGGHGGHNGLRSIVEQLGGNGFARVRIGVGKPGREPGTATGGDPRATGGGPPRSSGEPGGRGTRAAPRDTEKDVAGWVLADFPSAQGALVDALLARAADAVEAVVGLGVTPAMNQFNGMPAVTG
ncbi:MAG TPA: aminoacyl-tRNA hydrolase [Kofleriaceae bacterium]|nr:aminoacyl-tRNA hydrolase [Kofleriaceae bacterium]